MPADAFDLVVHDGTVVTAGGRGRCDVGVSGGRIAALGIGLRGERMLDAGGAYVLPGGVDMHVHLSAVAPGPGEPPRFVDDFHVGTRAALAGGVTTVGNMSFPDEGQTVSEALARDLAAAAEQAVADYALHPGVYLADDDLLERVGDWAEAGHMGLKIVMLAFDHDPRHLVPAVKRAGDLGMLTMVHCEDDAIIEFRNEELVSSGRGGLAHYHESRPDYTETAAVERAIAICEATGAPMLVVHLSSASALAAARRARARGLPLFVETRPIYLQLTDAVHAGPDPGRFVSMPPVRSAGDVEALWTGLADGSIQTIGSDHAPWLLRDKVDPALDIPSCRKGMAELETMIPLVYTRGVRTGRISLERLVAVCATNPARLHGLYPRKGTIAVGADADLLVLDPERSRVVDGSAMESRAGYSPLDGMELWGWPRATVSRGAVVHADGAITAAAAPGRGAWLPRGRTEAA